MANPVDPVCGMELQPGQVEAQSRYNGKAYYFCSEECKRIFDENPQEYADAGGSSPGTPPAGSGS